MSDIPPPTVPPTTPPPPGGGSYTPPPPPPPPPPAGGAGSGDRTVMLILSYFGILSLIPYLTKKEDPEILWHAKNGVALFGVEVIVFIVVAILTRIPVLGCIVAPLYCIVSLGFLVISVVCIMKAINGERFRLPVITDFAEKSL